MLMSVIHLANDKEVANLVIASFSDADDNGEIKVNKHELTMLLNRLLAVDQAIAEFVKLTKLERSSFQSRVRPWLIACFGKEIAEDRIERNHRFYEEATELVQSTGMTRSEAHQLVDYVFGRPSGDPRQEIGGVQITLAALGLAYNYDISTEAERELFRCWDNCDKIRTKQKNKPRFSPLPE